MRRTDRVDQEQLLQCKRKLETQALRRQQVKVMQFTDRIFIPYSDWRYFATTKNLLCAGGGDASPSSPPGSATDSEDLTGGHNAVADEAPGRLGAGPWGAPEG